MLDAEGREIDPEAPDGAAAPGCSGLPADPALDAASTPWITLGLAVLVLVGTVAMVAAHEDELPRRLRAEHLHRHPGDGPAASLEAEDAAAAAGRGGTARGSTASRPCRSPSARAARPCARVPRRRRRRHLLGHHRPDADQVQVREDVQHGRRRSRRRRRPSRSPPAVAASARATSRSMSRRPIGRRLAGRRPTRSWRR